LHGLLFLLDAASQVLQTPPPLFDRSLAFGGHLFNKHNGEVFSAA
jgi:hypothetical protein